MSFYTVKGSIPNKRHTKFLTAGKKLLYEELVSRQGFSGIFSNLYHLRMPTRVKKIENFIRTQLYNDELVHKPLHFQTSKIKTNGDAISSRLTMLYNSDVVISKSHFNASMDYCYRNADFDEVIYIQSGKGKLLTNFGTLDYENGDYIVIPRGVIWHINCDNKTHALVIESSGPVKTPKKNRNEFGQLIEGSPFCERDIKTPQYTDPIDSNEDTVVRVRYKDGVQDMIYANHPFDVVGWDGSFYPWIFNINDFEPIVGSIHQPPPVHQTFEGVGFVICSFVTRLFDFHKNAIPAPYPHSNVDSEEVIFYSMGEFMSRKGVEEESLTLHPSGLPHGPHPGRYEESIGKVKTEELAVMIDTFKPLCATNEIKKVMDKKYELSWNK